MPPHLPAAEAAQAEKKIAAPSPLPDKGKAAPKLRPHQVLGVSYYLERLYPGDRVKRFLEIFAAVLQHSNYGHLLDTYARVGAKCGQCACACQIYQQTRDPRDVPCYRSGLLLETYRRHFTLRGVLQSKLSGSVYLTEERIRELAESVYHCTGCRRCTFQCPMGIDHGLLTHLSRYILSEMDIVPKALVVATREQLEGETGNTSAIPVPALLDAEKDVRPYCWEFHCCITSRYGSPSQEVCEDCLVHRSGTLNCWELHGLLPATRRRFDACADCGYHRTWRLSKGEDE